VHQSKSPLRLQRAFLFVALLGLHLSQLNIFPLHSSFTYTAKQIVGKKIKFLREQKGMTQQELADLVKQTDNIFGTLKQAGKILHWIT
jgi:hypothetical protein